MYSPTPDELLQAIEREELFVVFQPQLAARDGTIAAVEALVRWRHPHHGVVGPGHFVTLAEQHGLVGRLTRRVLEDACRAAARWPQLSIGVNISATELRTPDFADYIADVAVDAGLPLERLELEIVESAFIDDFEAAVATVESLRNRGIRVALDDFGTGYSSLTYLRRLPIDKIKIDKSFVDGVDKVQSAAIVHAVVALGRALGLKVCAEGVETPLQQQFLKAAGCHLLQGYLFSRPVDAAQIDLMLAKNVAPKLVSPRLASG
ncbi:EAL domain-containing protein [Terrarubrum flagellatum]|uniref:putative bifunctional diguanylate cyclase/phosphodiesterase n=1 Tax=Terrirubrum flagellatum TaxID=2895980 RepID=UPI003144E327